MTLTTSNSLRYFPYQPRPHQKEAVDFAVDIFANEVVGLLSADCGVGKTIAVLSAYFAARATENSSRLFVVTRTHSQSRIFENELSVLRTNIPNLTSTTLVSRVHLCPNRSNMDTLTNIGFMRACSLMIRSGHCSYYWQIYRKSGEGLILREEADSVIADLLNNGIVTRETVETIVNESGLCPYELLKICAQKSRVIIGPYLYLFKSRVRAATLAFLNTDLSELDIIVDEAHNLSSHVLDSETAILNGRDLLWLRQNRDSLAKSTTVTWLGDAIDFLWETFVIHLDAKHSREVVIEPWDIFPRFVNISDLEILQDEKLSDFSDPDRTATVETPVDRLIEFLHVAHQATKEPEWHITLESNVSNSSDLEITRANIVIRPFNSAALTSSTLSAARSALLMSGTLQPTFHYARILGVSEAKTAELASPYPRGTRLVLVDRNLSTRYHERKNDLWRKIANRISAALTVMPANKSAMIAFPSYAILRDVLSYGIKTGFRDRIVETPSARVEDLVEAVQSGPQVIFSVYGGKFSEGIDLVESGASLLDLIIGVGVPFVPPTSYQRAFQEWIDARYGKGTGYYYLATIPAFRKVTQLIGRLRRAPSDWGVVILLDRRFLNHLNILGKDIATDVWPFTSLNELKTAIQQFLDFRVRDENERG